MSEEKKLTRKKIEATKLMKNGGRKSCLVYKRWSIRAAFINGV
jgi:hypothetical protein